MPAVFSSRVIQWHRGLSAPEEVVGGRTSHCLWFAGFIANRKELIACLGAAAEEDDVSLLVRACSRDPVAAASLIAGPCSWIFWHEENRRLYALRDRLGTHPLFFTLQGDLITLSGRVEDLLPESAAVLNETSVARQICGGIPDPGETFYRDVHAIEAGTILLVDSHRLVTRVYWRPEAASPLRLRSDADYAVMLRERLVSVVGEYLPDEPVGVTLSGGLDSTAVAAATRRRDPGRSLLAFSWAAPELPEADESALAAEVCRALGAAQVTIAADQEWPLRRALRLPRSSPLVNSYSALWDETFRVVRSKGVRVLLSGLSGDNLVGGNVVSYPDLFWQGRWLRLAIGLVSHHRRFEADWYWLLRYQTLGPIARFLIPRRARGVPPAWLGPRLRELGSAPSPEVPRRLLPGRRRRLEYLREPQLRVVAALATDQAAEHGIDFRHPWLDHRLFELAASFPSDQTFRGGSHKFVLRNALQGLLPDQVVGRLGKTYPSPIFDRGLREREHEQARGLLTNMVAARMGFVVEAPLRAAYERYLAGETEDDLFWQSLTLEAWLRLHFT
ncbi:MAG TPA: asparagine synthase-related protein [Thermoanaerobaculia bacterium]|nr:asparagine synthase-related protein [Thermoanaerobaculia bacterium]